MKHGRPEYEGPRWERSAWYDRSVFTVEEGWRREHAHRVWSAMQAVLAVICVTEVHTHTKWMGHPDVGHPFAEAGWVDDGETRSTAHFFQSVADFLIPQSKSGSKP